MEPLYVARPAGMGPVNLLFGLAMAASVVITVILVLTSDDAAALITGAVLVAVFTLIFVILPRRYEVWPDHLALVFPAGRWRIRYEGIEVIRESTWFEPYAFAGVRFATSPSRAVTILRREGNFLTRPGIVISPEDRPEFLRQLRRAMSRPPDVREQS